MFFHDFNRERVVEVPDVSPDGFRAMLRYIYTDEANITADNIESVVQLSDKYLLTGLFAECVEWVKQNLTAANVCRFLPLGEMYGEVGQVCYEFASDHGKDVLKTEAFLNLSRDLLAKLFASDRLAADEVTIYSRAIDWAKRQLEMTNQQCDATAIREALGDVLYRIRFPLFDAEEFASGPAESGILSADECVSVFKWFTAKKKPSLFSVDARALLDIEGLLKHLGAPRSGTCEHERGVWVDVDKLLKLYGTTAKPCQHSSPWICLTCNGAFCSDRNSTCGLFYHSQQTQHGLHFYRDSRVTTMYCGKCDTYLS
ncbi:BTB/POZ domain-containing protein 2 [Aphelenchoides avenae]|nr:BTB/POZ domain-containing protein 2 [Aphelenchus avenae]